MKAYILEAPSSFPVFKDVESKIETGKKKVIIKSSALNHRDLWICKGLYPGIEYPIILGSDGAGNCEGEEILINPSHNWGDQEEFQGNKYKILGLPENGTFCEEQWINEKYLHPKPDHLNWNEAAALPLAGLTAYRALITQAKAAEGERVLITGVGGGVALFAMQFALAKDLAVWVNSGYKEKIDKAIHFGAKGGQNYQDEDWIAKLKEMNPKGFDIIIDGAGGKDFSKLLNLLNPGGRAVIYGGTAGKITSINPQLIFWKQLTVQGSTMGSESDFENMLSFVVKHKIHPIIDKVFPLAQAEKGFKRMDEGKQFGKIIFNNQ